MKLMVDTPARKIAAAAIGAFRDGLISNYDFEGKWPTYDKEDRALFAIQTMLWRYYDDLHEHKLSGPHALTQESRNTFQRCILFLGTELEYKWPRDDFIGGWYAAGSADVITLGLSDSADTVHRQIDERELLDLHVIGDDPVWPFLTRTEFETHRDRLSQV